MSVQKYYNFAVPLINRIQEVGIPNACHAKFDLALGARISASKAKERCFSSYAIDSYGRSDNPLRCDFAIWLRFQQGRAKYNTCNKRGYSWKIFGACRLPILRGLSEPGKSRRKRRHHQRFGVSLRSTHQLMQSLIIGQKTFWDKPMPLMRRSLATRIRELSRAYQSPTYSESAFHAGFVRPLREFGRWRPRCPKRRQA